LLFPYHKATFKLQDYLPLPRHNCRISIAVTQTCLQALSIITAYNTVHISALTFPVIALKNNFESRIPQSLPISNRGYRSNIALITNILQMLSKSEWNSHIVVQKKLFQRKKNKKNKMVSLLILQPFHFSPVSLLANFRTEDA